MGNNRRNLTEEDYEKIITSKLIFNKTVPAISEEMGISETSVTVVGMIFGVCQKKDWPRAVDMIENKSGYPLSVFEWACKRLSIEMPRTLKDANDRKNEKARQEYQAKQAKKAAAEKEEVKPKQNDSLYYIKILEALNRQNELLLQLIDTVIPKYVQDMKDNNNANADMLHNTLKEIGDACEGVKINTRKRGL